MTTRCLIGVVVEELSALLAASCASAPPEPTHASAAPASRTAASSRLRGVIAAPLVEISTPAPIEPIREKTLRPSTGPARIEAVKLPGTVRQCCSNGHVEGSAGGPPSRRRQATCDALPRGHADTHRCEGVEDG